MELGYALLLSSGFFFEVARGRPIATIRLPPSSSSELEPRDSCFGIQFFSGISFLSKDTRHHSDQQQWRMVLGESDIGLSAMGGPCWGFFNSGA